MKSSTLPTLFLALAIGSTMTAANFINLQTLGILVLGLLAFVIDTVAGFVVWQIDVPGHRRQRINPLIGACGISGLPDGWPAFRPMALDEDL